MQVFYLITSRNNMWLDVPVLHLGYLSSWTPFWNKMKICSYHRSAGLHWLDIHDNLPVSISRILRFLYLQSERGFRLSCLLTKHANRSRWILPILNPKTFNLFSTLNCTACLHLGRMSPYGSLHHTEQQSCRKGARKGCHASCEAKQK